MRRTEEYMRSTDKCIRHLYLTCTSIPGTYHWAKANSVYDGDWKEDKRHGYGTFSIIVNELPFKQYGGGWKNDKRHG